MSVTVGRNADLHNLRPVSLNGKRVGGCFVGRERFSSRTQISFYPNSTRQNDPWIFQSIADMRERLPSAWGEHQRMLMKKYLAEEAGRRASPAASQ